MKNSYLRLWLVNESDYDKRVQVIQLKINVFNSMAKLSPPQNIYKNQKLTLFLSNKKVNVVFELHACKCIAGYESLFPPTIP